MESKPDSPASFPQDWGLIEERIRIGLPTMEGAFKKIALFILEDPQGVGFSTIQSLGRSIGVSEASIMRFAKSVGFSGFADFKKAIHFAIKHQLNPYGEIALSELSSLDDSKQINKLIHYELNNLKRTFNNLSIPNLTKIVEDLRQAEHVFVAGFGALRCVAELYGFLLMSNPGKLIFTISGSVPDYIGTLNQFTDRDVMIIASLPPYAREEGQVAEFVKSRNGRIYLFTDSPKSPAYPFAASTILCGNRSLLYTNSYVGLISSFKVLLDAWVLSDRNLFMKRMKPLTELLNQSYFDLNKFNT
jgi:DNA-binding MurR/RpiR family transcriptional regulator